MHLANVVVASILDTHTHGEDTHVCIMLPPHRERCTTIIHPRTVGHSFDDPIKQDTSW